MATTPQAPPTTENGESDDPREALADEILELPSPDRVEELEDAIKSLRRILSVPDDRNLLERAERIQEAAGHYQAEAVDSLENLGIDTETESDEERPLANETRRIREALNLSDRENKTALEAIRGIKSDRDEAVEQLIEAQENDSSEELEEAREEIKRLKRKNANLREENESLEEQNNELQERLSSAQAAICGEG